MNIINVLPPGNISREKAISVLKGLNFEIVEDVVYISDEQKKAILKSIETAENGNIYTQKELFDKIDQRWK